MAYDRKRKTMEEQLNEDIVAEQNKAAEQAAAKEATKSQKDGI